MPRWPGDERRPYIRNRGVKPLLHSNRSILDPDQIPHANLVKELDDAEVGHLDAAAAERRAESFLVVGPVDIDVAGVSIDVAALIHSGLEAAEPEDARSDQVALLFVCREFREMLAGGDARLEHDARR